MEPPQAAERLPAAGVCIGAPRVGDAGDAAELPAVIGAEALGRLLDLPAAAIAQAVAVEQATGFVVRVPQTFAAEMARGDLSDPLLLQVWPQRAELCEAEGYVGDPLREVRACAAPLLIRKYQGRALLLAGEQCAIHCRFCFRRHSRQVLPYATCNPDERPSAAGAARFDAAMRVFAGDSSLSEAILSGGDPLTLSDRQLDELIKRLADIPHLRRVRLHSRIPMIAPHRISAELVALLRSTRLTPWIVVHVNHPRELAADAAAAAARLSEAGIPLLSQTVLLRDVNDRFEVLAELFERLIDLRVAPYYLHQLDPVAGAAHFAVDVDRGRALIARLRSRLPGYAVPRYVQETPGATSKVILE